nr:arabinogalactan-protein homolog [Arabidopsis thaliana]
MASKSVVVFLFLALVASSVVAQAPGAAPTISPLPATPTPSHSPRATAPAPSPSANPPPSAPTTAPPVSQPPTESPPAPPTSTSPAGAPGTNVPSGEAGPAQSPLSGSPNAAAVSRVSLVGTFAGVAVIAALLL